MVKILCRPTLLVYTDIEHFAADLAPDRAEAPRVIGVLDQPVHGELAVLAGLELADLELADPRALAALVARMAAADDCALVTLLLVQGVALLDQQHQCSSPVHVVQR